MDARGVSTASSRLQTRRACRADCAFKHTCHFSLSRARACATRLLLKMTTLFAPFHFSIQLFSFTCDDDSLSHVKRRYRNVESRNTTCFSKCPGARSPPALPNRSTTCVVECFQETALRLKAADLISPWELAFASEDGSKGGCPACAANTAGAYVCPVW